jgi:hypothetical protein
MNEKERAVRETGQLGILHGAGSLLGEGATGQVRFSLTMIEMTCAVCSESLVSGIVRDPPWFHRFRAIGGLSDTEDNT